MCLAGVYVAAKPLGDWAILISLLICSTSPWDDYITDIIFLCASTHTCRRIAWCARRQATSTLQTPLGSRCWPTWQRSARAPPASTAGTMWWQTGGAGTTAFILQAADGKMQMFGGCIIVCHDRDAFNTCSLQLQSFAFLNNCIQQDTAVLTTS